MSHATEFLMWGLVAHLVTDWLCQNDWMAMNKASLRHPAAWVHSGIYTLGMAVVFPWYLALLLGLAHAVIDTRKPLTWWRATIGQLRDGTVQAWTISIWNDQALHIALLAVAALWMGAR